MLRRQQGGGSVMIRAAFSYHKHSKTAFLKQRKNSKGYHDMLEGFMLPFVAVTNTKNGILLGWYCYLFKP